MALLTDRYQFGYIRTIESRKDSMAKVLKPGKICSADDIRRYPHEEALSFTEEEFAQLEANAAALDISPEDYIEQRLNDIRNRAAERHISSLVADGLRITRESVTLFAVAAECAREQQDTCLIEILQRLQTGAVAMLATYTDVALMIARKDDDQPFT